MSSFKKNHLVFAWSCLFWLFCGGSAFAQSSSCGDAYLSPFCDGIAQYPANFDGTGLGSGPQAPTGPNYDCLGTQGNPTYFSLTIDQAGTINFTLDNTAGVDIDFILWGPFNGVNEAQLACDSMGTGGIWGGVANCSYSSNGQEQVSITNAQIGEVYILMVTNYTNVATNIFSTSNTGTGGVACACAIPYSIDTLPASIGNQGILTDTANGINQFVLCPGNTLGIDIQAKGNLRDTLNLYGPFTTINNAFPINTIFAQNPNAPNSFDSLQILALITATNDNIGINTFSVGLRNDFFTGGLIDSTCFDFLGVEVIVPGVKTTDRNVCLGQTINVTLDSIPSTIVGSSTYAWRQISGLGVTISNPSGRSTQITLPTGNSSSSNDSILIVVDYTYGGTCPMSDTMVLHLPDQSISAAAIPSNICAGDTALLNVSLLDTLNPAVCDDYEVTVVPFAPVAVSGATNVSTFTATSTFPATDDGISAALPIGFPFKFYCNTQTSFYIHTNGFITFDAAPPGSGGLYNAPMPNNILPNNIIAFGWADLNFNSGSFTYTTQGTAPNRRLVVTATTIPSFGTGSITAQVILYETTNAIEIHITNNNILSSVVGIENANGSLAHVPPPLVATRGLSVSNITNTAYRFTLRNNGPLFAWTPRSSLSNATLSMPSALPLSTTLYTVAVTDGPCLYTDTVSVQVQSNYPAPTVACGTRTDSTLNITWNNIGLPASGFYEYSLDGGATWINVGANFSATIPGLLSNTTYTILVRGNDGTNSTCILSPSGSVSCTTAPISCSRFPDINISLGATNLLCNGDSTACITSTITGGSGNPFNYFWSTGATDTNQICNLPAGLYMLTVTDTIATVGPPVFVSAYEEAFDLGLAGWTLNVSTGTNGADNNFWVVNNNEAGQPIGNCGASGGSNQSLHITSVINSNGGAAYNAGGQCPLLFCPETNMRAESPVFSTVGLSNLTFEFNYIANGDTLLDNASVVYNDGTGWQTLDPSIKSNTCTGGQGEWTRFSMTLPASCNNNPSVQVGFNWTNNDDGIGTDPSVAIDSISIFSFQSLPTVCKDTQSIIITQPSPIFVAVDTSINPSCSGVPDGLVIVSASGGTPGYTYNWNNGTNNDTLSNVPDGTYTVVAMDLNGCSDTTVAILNPVNPIVVSITSVNNSSCVGQPDGSISITAIGGTGSLTYQWSNNATTQNLINVSDGTYTVTVTDGSGCFSTAQATITPTVLLTISNTIVPPNCAGDSARVTLTVTGGSGAYQYNWGSTSSSTSNTAILPGGNYITTITDIGNGCTQLDTLVVIEPPVLTVALVNTTDIGCSSAANSGAIDVTTSGGTPTYTFLWSDNNSTEDLSNIAAGNYSLTVTDVNGCVATLGPVTISKAADVTASIQGNTLTLACDQQPIGSLTARATGGTGITYQWSNNSTDSTINNLAAGTYTVIATNADGCSDTVSQTITAPIVPTLNAYVQAPNTKEVTVDNNTVVPLNAGSTGFDYLWMGFGPVVTGASSDPGLAATNVAATTATPTPVGLFTYIVTASATTNDTICTVTDTVYITVQPPFVGIPDAFTPNNDNVNELFRPVYLSDEEIQVFRVFNRWGQEVYNGEQNNNEGWDGTYQGVPQNMDVYLYILTYQRPTDPKPRTVKGEMTLLR